MEPIHHWAALNIVDSALGRALCAVHGAEVGAVVVGVDTARVKALIFVVSAVIASLIGSLFAHYAGIITPEKAGFFKSIELGTMVVFGGMASTFETVVGAATLTALPQALTIFEDFKHMIIGAILMGTMIFMPRGLAPTLKESAGALSGGQQQMLALGRALMSRPRLLLLDEPSMGLAPLLVAEIFEALKKLKAAGATIFLVEQNAFAALGICDRGCVLETGEVKIASTGKTRLADDQVRQIYLGL